MPWLFASTNQVPLRVQIESFESMVAGDFIVSVQTSQKKGESSCTDRKQSSTWIELVYSNFFMRRKTNAKTKDGTSWVVVCNSHWAFCLRVFLGIHNQSGCYGLPHAPDLVVALIRFRCYHHRRSGSVRRTPISDERSLTLHPTLPADVAGWCVMG